MEKDDKGSTMIRMGVSGWMFLLVLAYPGCPGSKAVKRSLLLLLLLYLKKLCACSINSCVGIAFSLRVFFPGGSSWSHRVWTDPRVCRPFSDPYSIPLAVRGNAGASANWAEERAGAAVPETLQHGHGNSRQLLACWRYRLLYTVKLPGLTELIQVKKLPGLMIHAVMNTIGIKAHGCDHPELL